MSGARMIREGRAPRAMLSDVCRRRSIPRTSIRLATLAHTMRSAHPVTDIRIASQCWYRSRMLVMPAPPGRRNNVCAWSVARSFGLICSRCVCSHSVSPRRMRASTAADDAPAPTRPITASQCVSCRTSAGSSSMRGSAFNGRKKSGGLLRSVSPKKPGGAMPTTVNVRLFRVRPLPTIDGSPPNCCIQSAVAQHHDGTRARTVVGRCQRAPSIGGDTEHREVVP